MGQELTQKTFKFFLGLFATAHPHTTVQGVRLFPPPTLEERKVFSLGYFSGKVGPPLPGVNREGGGYLYP